MSFAVGKLYQDGDIIIRQGELGNCMFIVQEGRVEMLHRLRSSEFCLGVLEAGDFFEPLGVLGHEVRSCTVRAVGPARVLSLEKRTFIQRMHEDASFVFKIVRRLALRNKQLEEMLVRTAEGPIESATDTLRQAPNREAKATPVVS